MDADELQVGEVAGDLVEADRPPHALARIGRRVDQALAHLQLHRHVEFDAFVIERIPLGMVGRQLEPVRIEMRADEAKVGDGALEFLYALAQPGRVEAGEAREAVGMLLHRLGDEQRCGVAQARRDRREERLRPGVRELAIARVDDLQLGVHGRDLAEHPGEVRGRPLARPNQPRGVEEVAVLRLDDERRVGVAL